MVNKITLIGNVGKDPETRTTTSGKEVTNFSLATSEKYKDQDITQWHKIVSWSQSAKKIKKGDKLYIEGKINYRSWEKEDGSKAYITEIVAHVFLFMNPRQDTPANHGGYPEQKAPQGWPEKQPANVPAPETDDLPF